MRQQPQVRDAGGESGFTYLELLVALALFAGFSVVLLQTFIIGMAHAGRANDRSAATTLAIQVMEQVRASVNPYEMVGFTDLTRSPLPLPDPYTGVTNPTPHTFQVAVDITLNENLRLTTATVQVYRLTDPDGSPFVSLTTVLDDQ
ncbi:MAG: type II secretion system protein [Armatimonadetes bacterium]|nr:type II secretion system protein [Armatimonadota bacterium]